MTMALYLIGRTRGAYNEKRLEVARFVRHEYNDPNPLWLRAEGANGRVEDHRFDITQPESRTLQMPQRGRAPSIGECCAETKTPGTSPSLLPDIGCWNGNLDNR